MSRVRYVWGLASFVLVALGVGSAAAQPAEEHDAREARLRGFSRAELQIIEPLLEQGVFGLVDHSVGPRMPAVHIAARVRAPAHAVTDLLSRPEGYPRFMPLVREVTARPSRGAVTGFSWRWQTPLVSLDGEAMSTVLRSSGPDRRRGDRVVIERTGGQLGLGREVWRVLPRPSSSGADESLVLLSSRVDLRGPSALGGQVGTSLSRSLNVAMAFDMLLSMRAHAERAAGRARRASPRPLRAPSVDLVRLEPLMERGDLLLIDAPRTAMRQIALMTRYQRMQDQVRGLMSDPLELTRSLLSRRTATIEAERGPDGVRFDWDVNRPVFGASGAMRLQEHEDGRIELTATDGAMRGGRWLFSTVELPSHATGVLSWGRFDVGDVNGLLRGLVEADPALGAGLSAASEIMLAWAIRLRLRQLPRTGFFAR